MDGSKGLPSTFRGATPPEQGTYLLTNVSFATHPLRLEAGDSAEMRQVPDEFDGIEPDSPTLPPPFVFLAGIGVIVESDANRKGSRVARYPASPTSKKSTVWQKWSLRLGFEDTACWAAWTVPGARTLVTFDAVMFKQEFDGQYQCCILASAGSFPFRKRTVHSSALLMWVPQAAAREAKRLFLEKKN
ncbi:hypothetical protein CF319_g6931 [Tilletia indica]|nr:hypothetical protein CF319_g6931 [Tilletia indica]